jgi:hypothetical protein
MKYILVILKLHLVILLFACCSSEIIEISPASPTDTSDVEITCNASQGNKGLLDFQGDVFVHMGLITDSSEHPRDWRYVKFKWGSTEPLARAAIAGRNRWSYKIPNIREYFGVNKNEKVFKLAILFREGNCIDTFCKVLRNADKSDIMIDLAQK